MSSGPNELRQLVTAARAGDRVALGRLLDCHRPYLKVLTLRQLDGALGGRIDASDVVQQTCLAVVGKFAEFAGTEVGEFLAWLRTVHQHNIINSVRQHRLAKKRAVGQEEEVGSSAAVADVADTEQTSPSQRLMRNEDSVRLAVALQVLPDEQREAVRLRYLEGKSLAEIAERMQRTKFSVAGLVKRGLIGLRKKLDERAPI